MSSPFQSTQQVCSFLYFTCVCRNSQWSVYAAFSHKIMRDHAEWSRPIICSLIDIICRSDTSVHCDMLFMNNLHSNEPCMWLVFWHNFTLFLLTVVSRPDGSVSMEDVDRIQLELEALLSAAAIRRKTLGAEIKLINSLDKRRSRPVTAVRRRD